jgi:carbon monoxide dehydrogenase subunit G
MPSVQRTFTVTPPPAEVIDYLKDFANAVEWDPGTQSCTQNGSGPVAVGTTWHNVSKVAGFTTELEYELTELTDRGLVFVGRNKGATSTDTISVLPVGEGSEVTYRADIDMHGVSAVATPVMKVVLERLGNETEEQLQRVLNARS